MSRRKTERRLLAAGLLALGALAVCLLLWQRRAALAERTEIILIQKALDDTDFWTSVAQGGEMAAEEHDADLTVMGPAESRRLACRTR